VEGDILLELFHLARRAIHLTRRAIHLTRRAIHLTRRAIHLTRRANENSDKKIKVYQMDDFDGIWSKRLENERNVSTLYRERSLLLEHELSLTRNLLSKAIHESAVETKKVYPRK